MTAGRSDVSESPQSAQPLLHNFEAVQNKNLSDPSLQSFENGEDSGLDFEVLGLQKRPSFWQRLRMSMRRRYNRVEDDGECIREASRSVRSEEKKIQIFRRRKRCCLTIPVVILSFFGLIHLLNLFLGYVPLLRDDPAVASLDWTKPDEVSTDIAAHLLDITRDVRPIPCHSHNDYWRRVPLYDALRWGCTGVEADVWLFENDLFVGHTTSALTKSKTFTTMYIDPLVKMLDHNNPAPPFPNESLSAAVESQKKNGIFQTSPTQTLVLLVDFKNNGHEIFPHVARQLAPLREKGYLSSFNGETTSYAPITVVATGNAPFDSIVANSTYRDIFFDAPLDRFYQDKSSTKSAKSGPTTVNQDLSKHKTQRFSSSGQGTVGTSPNTTFSAQNSYYASAKFSKAVGHTFFYLSDRQIDIIRGQIRGAHARGLKARYWSTPAWPVGLRNRVWKVLVEEGVDYLNGDDLRGMSRWDWGWRGHWSLVG